MPPDSAEPVHESARTRSAVSNGTKPFASADGRSREARLLRDRERELSVPLGGLVALTTAERAQVQAAAALSVRLEEVRSCLARGEAGASDEDLVRLTNGLTRALGAIDKAAVRKRAQAGGKSPLQSFMDKRGAA